nr:nucleoside hydrolase [uncultured Cohaesibacter sp.]
MKLIIDTDPGIDDALAIAYAALHPDIELLGLTTVFGNVTTAQATRNALYLSELMGLSIPVAAGAVKPMKLPPFAPKTRVHGPEGLGDLPAPSPFAKAHDMTAAQFLCNMAALYPGELVVCPIGPITNIADALKMDPAFAQNVDKIVFMGGALDVRGNVTPYAEANAFHDPHALDAVLSSGANVTMVGLDVTLQVLLNDKDFTDLANKKNGIGVFLKDLGRFYLDFYQSIGLNGCGLHDPMAVIAALYPALFKMETLSIEVKLEGEESGQTCRSQSKERPTCRVSLDCDAHALRSEFFKVFDN